MKWAKTTSLAAFALGLAIFKAYAGAELLRETVVKPLPQIVVPDDYPYDKRIYLYHSVLLKRAPGLVTSLDDYGAEDDGIADCSQKKSQQTHAILVGARGSDEKPLEGPENDVELFASVLADLGVAPRRIYALTGETATRRGLSLIFRHVLNEAGCGDRVILHVSGSGGSTSKMMRKILGDAADLVSAEDFATYFSKDAINEMLEHLRSAVLKHRDKEDSDAAALVDFAELQLAVDDLAILLDGNGKEHYDTVRGQDLSDFVAAVRKKGVHAVVVLDVSDAGLASIADRQRAAGDGSSWSYRFVSEGGSERTLEWPSDHGELAVFYAAAAGYNTPEMLLPKEAPDRKKYGLFSFVVTGGMLEAPAATPRKLAATIERSYSEASRRNVRPVVEATSPDLILIAEAAPQRQDAIRIISPAPQRGAVAVDEADIDIEGAVEWPAPVLGVFVDDANASMEPGGRFRHTVRLKTGLNVVNIHAVTADNRMHSRKLEILFEGDLQALEGEGTRYAVIIANQNYAEQTGMPDLSTPFADADAVAEILAREYGFATELVLPNGKKLPLILKDPTKRDIEVALFQLGKVAGKNDTVLIFYAGHGVFEPVTSTAYWVPSDAEMGFEPSYLSAADISAGIQRIQADHVILISDSCYAGALMRGGGERPEEIGEEERMQVLLKLQSSRSRIVITSGNNEPVADLGGGEHSVFARALLNGFEKMEHDAFSARELFDDYILPQVVANADQEPQFRPLEKVGHEGGDFVFVKMSDAANASAD
jgi:hypothetical protein